MLSPIEPRCTGMCGALAMSAPSAVNTAQEKSSRSLMLTEVAVYCSATPICSAIAMKRLLNTSSMTGSALRAGSETRCAGASRAFENEIAGRVNAMRAIPGSTTVVDSARR